MSAARAFWPWLRLVTDQCRFCPLAGVCNAVAYAHSRGVLHRDLKSGNIMLGEFGEMLAVDWGLAKVVGTGGSPHPDGGEGSGVRGKELTLRPASGSRIAETRRRRHSRPHAERHGYGGGRNGTNVLEEDGAGRNVSLTDGAADVLTGGLGEDWFFSAGADLMTDLAGGEQVN